jgi:ABC-type branched-subunit amino acid transport system ATPase component
MLRLNNIQVIYSGVILVVKGLSLESLTVEENLRIGGYSVGRRAASWGKPQPPAGSPKRFPFGALRDLYVVSGNTGP